MSRFATAADYEVCRALHQHHGTTYYLATQCFPREARERTHAIYGFVRVPDEWVDNPGEMSVAERAAKLADFRAQMLAGWWTEADPKRPEEPVLRAFCDVAGDVKMPVEEPLLFLDAMEMDLTVERYPTYADLDRYMRGSAAAVGVMMCYALGVDLRPETHTAACNLGNAMQLTNFLRDVREDAARGRIYLPLEDLARFGIPEEHVLEGQFSPQFEALARFEADRARALYAAADPELDRLPAQARKAVRLARVLYARILDRIEAQGYNVFAGRVRTSAWEKAIVAARVVLSG